MFTVKATYRGETRKLSFPECSYTFPSFDQLNNQLYRVFPISHNYFLSKLLFSPDSSKSRILVAREVHSADEYTQAIAHLGGRSFANPLLRFSVIDETPHKLPSVVPFFAKDGDRETYPIGPSHYQDSKYMSHPPISLSHIPPPPIIYSSGPFPTGSRVPSFPPMDIDQLAPMAPLNHAQGLRFPQHPETPRKRDAAPVTACCDVTQGKQEVEALITKFKEDLEVTLKKAFGPGYNMEHSLSTLNPLASTSIPTPAPPTQAAPMLCLYKYCMPCGKIFQGAWYTCDKCSVVMCSGCHGQGMSKYCFAVAGPHIMKKETCAACPKDESLAASAPVIPIEIPQFQGNNSSNTWGTPAATTSMPTLNAMLQPRVSYGTPTSAMPFARRSRMPLATTAAQTWRPLEDPTRGARQVAEANANTSSVPTPTPPVPAPVVHSGILCDSCNTHPEGIRHKCLDCPDYDLCTSCISSGAAEEHNPFHEFFEIHVPGRVIVHTVHSGPATSAASAAANLHSTTDAQVEVEILQEPIVHDARCDLCDSRIRGSRFKCLDCPDYDTCEACFSITGEHHPHHAFVKIKDPIDYIRPENAARPSHFATCNACTKGINGVRYKCMHPECPDFDLCEVCEAHPIAVHPSNHPLLKMKSAETVVPTVYRVGQTTLIEQRAAPSSLRSSSDARDMPGFIGSSNKPSVRFQDTLLSPTIPPPSPFFYERETSAASTPPRLDSPSLMYSRTPSPPLAIPGGLPPLPSVFGMRSQPPIPESFMRGYSYYDPIQKPSPFFANHPPRPQPHVRVPGGYPNPMPSSSPIWNPYKLGRTPSPVESAKFEASDYSNSPFYSPRARSASPHRTPSIVEPPIVALPRRDRSYPVPNEDWRSPFEDPVFASVLRDIENEDAHIASTTQSNVGESSATTAASTESLPRVQLPPLTLDRPFSMWSRSSLGHLMQETASVQDLRETIATAFSGPLPSVPALVDTNVVEESPLGGEALLSRPGTASDEPEMTQTTTAPVTSGHHSLAALLTGYQSATSTLPSSVCASVNGVDDDKNDHFVTPVEEACKPLEADFIVDVTVPDGQVFPPGAEFMKCWRMVNSGTRDWPESTELVFVAGDMLVRNESVSEVKIGAVKAGSKVDLWTGELKAPDSPGRYVGYWRLKDNEGNLFGNNIWIDINVADSHQSESSNSSMTSSSVMVMPQSVSGPAQGNTPGEDAPSPQESPVTAPSAPSTLADYNDAASDNGSDASSASLISFPASSDEEDDVDAALWQDSRAHVSVDLGVASSATESAAPGTERRAANGEYVVLFDDSSSEED